MLAEMGYDAFAVDIFGDDTPTETVDHRRAAMGALFGDRERMRRLLRTGADMAHVAIGGRADDRHGLLLWRGRDAGDGAQ